MLWVNWYLLAVDKEGHALQSSAWWYPLEGKSPMITDWHTAGGSVSQLSQWTKLSTKYINTSFWHYNKWFCFLSNQIMVTKHACTSSWLPLAHSAHNTPHIPTRYNNERTFHPWCPCIKTRFLFATVLAICTKQLASAIKVIDVFCEFKVTLWLYFG